jgi:hypothetical protein
MNAPKSYELGIACVVAYSVVEVIIWLLRGV